MIEIDEDVIKRVWSKIQFGPGCWEWLAYINHDGYGRININGHFELAHRATWTIVNGPIPAELCVLHTCDNPGCVNPAHLWLGTQADNMLDMAKKGRAGGVISRIVKRKKWARIT